MPEYLAPGVFVEEVSFRAKSIEGVSTTTTGFVGATRYGPVDIEPDVLTSLVEFERVYGGKQQLEFGDDGAIDNYMWNAARAFFEEGGKRLYVARAFNGDVAATCARVIDPVPPANVTIQARFPGRAGESKVRLQLQLSQNKLAIRGTRAVLAASGHRDVVFLDNATLGGTDRQGLYLLTRNAQLDTWTFDDGNGFDFELQDLAGIAGASVQTLTATVYVEPQVEGLPFFAATGLALDRGHKTGGKPDSVFDFFDANPASPSAFRAVPIVIRAMTVGEATGARADAVAAQTAAQNADDGAAQDVTDREADRDTAQDEVDTPPPGSDPVVLQATLDAALAAVAAAQAIKSRTATALATATQITLNADAVLLAAGAGTARTGLDFANDYLAPAVEINRFTLADLAASTGIAPVLDATFILSAGSDGDAPDMSAFEGAEDATTNRKTGLVALEDIEDIAIVATPGSSYKADGAQAIANVLIGHAERMRYRIAVIDSIKGQSIAETRAHRAKFDSSYAAFYYPWVRIVDPQSGEENHYPPSGFVAGIYARNDIERAVYKAPANEVVTLALGFEKMLNKGQQEVLNPEGVNCFRYFEGRGNRLWGARTMSSDPEWKYVNLRRYFAYLERSIDKGTQWAVFEPNGERLWANVRSTIQDFLLNEWQNGALLGEKPEKSFFVKCDRSTMTQNDLDNGRLVCLVGVAPLRPAEFVIFRIGQWTADRKI